MTLSGYHTLTSPLHSNNSAYILSLIIYQLVDICMQLSHATNFGECISAHQNFFHIYKKPDKTSLPPHQPASLHPAPEIPMDYFQCLDVSIAYHTHIKGLLLNELSFDYAVCEDHFPCIPHVLSVLLPSLSTKLNQISMSNMIIHPMFFGVPDQITATLWHVCHVTASELLRIYSINLLQNHLNRTIQYHRMNDNLDDLFPSSLPWNMALQVHNKSTQANTILDAITYSKGIQCDSVQYFFLTKSFTILNWSDAYQTVPNNSSILFNLQLNQNKFTATDLAKIHTVYITSLKDPRIRITKENWFSSNLLWIMINN